MKKIMFLGLLILGSASAQTGAQVFSLNTNSLALLLQWTEAGGQLTGSAQVVSIQTKTISGLEVTNASLSGTRSGASYAFVLNKALAGIGVNSMAATVTGDILNIQLPSDSGGFTSLQLKRTTLDKFSANVNILKTKVSLAKSEAAARLAIQTIDVDNDPLEESTRAMSAHFQEVQTALAALRKVNTDLRAAAKNRQCDAFKVLVEKDTLGRQGLDEAVNSLTDEINVSEDLIPEVTVLVAQFDQSLNEYRKLSPSGSAALEKQTSPILSKARQLLRTNKLAEAKALQLDSVGLIHRLTNENDSMSCP